MKILVLGLDGASPAVLEDERLGNLRRLMDLGSYGAVQNTAAQASPAWLAMATSEPGPAPAGKPLWELAGSAVLVGVPEVPPQAPDATWARSFFGETGTEMSRPPDLFALAPAEAQRPGAWRVGNVEDIFRVGEAQWQLAQWLAANRAWKYFHCVDAGLAALADAGAVERYLATLDERIGLVIESLDAETVILIASCGQAGAEKRSEGMFVLASPDGAGAGHVEGATLLDLAPTLLGAAGLEVPATMQGRCLVGRRRGDPPSGNADESEQERLIRERLSGLGYI